MVLITGITGLIGSEIGRKFLEAGIPITAFYRASSDKRLVRDYQDHIDWIECDIRDIEQLKKTLTGIKTIIHAAGMVSFSKSDRTKMREINVGGTANIVNTALATGVEQFIHISSVAAIGRSKLNNISTENTPWNSEMNYPYYALTKYEAELQVWRGFEEGLSGFILNPVVVLGPGLPNQSSFRLFEYAAKGKPFYPPGYLNYVDARDVANCCLKLYERNTRHERFIISAGTESYQSVLSRIATLMNVRKPWIRLSGNSIRFAVFWDGIWSALTGQKRQLDSEMSRVNSHEYIFDNTKIVKELNYDFIPIEESIRWVVDRMKTG